MRRVNVVLFCGGRGSRALTEQLVTNPAIRLTLAVNGYDDGLSTGEIRRFLGDSLGPSDFRKNASTLARALRTCDEALVDLLDLRFPDDYRAGQALTSIRRLSGDTAGDASMFDRTIDHLVSHLDESARGVIAEYLECFVTELRRGGRQFRFPDCSLGNLVFAGAYLHVGRDFNRTVATYCAMLNIPAGHVENVTDGINAFLVALDRDQRLLASEAEIVDANRQNQIEDIFLVDRRPDEWREQLGAGNSLHQELNRRSVAVRPNPMLLDRIAEADVIVYAPGTQHSSLFPSYVTSGLGEHIARNHRAVKILVTNIQEDAEIRDSSATDIIKRALYYLRERDRKDTPAPFLITHYLINDPTQSDSDAPYVPFGRLQSLEDPRLVRIANYEDGRSGRHNASKVLAPFLQAFVHAERRPSVAVLLLDTESLDKVCQTMLEAIRAGIESQPVDVAFFYRSPKSLDDTLTATLPFRAHRVGTVPGSRTGMLEEVGAQGYDFTVLFESSGMYRGEDIVNLVSLLAGGRLDAVWGSRRLSMRDIRESYHLRYRRSPLIGAISYVGSHILSLMYLLLYGRYMSDALSGARAVRSTYLVHPSVISLDNKRLNQVLLSRILRQEGEIFETPVQFLSLSPDKANRTTVGDGLRFVGAILTSRFRGQ